MPEPVEPDAPPLDEPAPPVITRLRRMVRSIGKTPVRLAVFAVAINLSLFELFRRCTYRCYETSDDASMMTIAAGYVTGEPTEYLVFINILIGHVLKFLYDVTDGLNWYTLHFYAVHFVSMSALLFVLIRRRWSVTAIGLFLMLFLLELRMLLLIQFTTTSVVAATAGILLLLDAAHQRDRSIWVSGAMGVLLIVEAAMVRQQALSLVVIMTSPLLVLGMTTGRRKALIASGGMAAVLVWGVVAYDSWRYASVPEWATYREYNEVRGVLHDMSQLQDADPESKSFRKVGWTETDLLLFEDWLFAHPEVYSIENLRTLAAEHSGPKLNPFTLLYYLSDQLEYAKVYFGLTFLMLCCLGLKLGFRTRPMAAVVISLLLAGMICTYLSMYDKLPERISYSLIFICNAMIAWLILATPPANTSAKPPQRLTFLGHQFRLNASFRFEAVPSRILTDPKTRELLDLRRAGSLTGRGVGITLIGLGFATASLVISSTLWKINSQNQLKQDAYSRFVAALQLDFLDRTKDPVFIRMAATPPIGWASSTSNARDLKAVNLVNMGWLTHSPLYEEELKRFGIDDLYSAMWDRDDIFLLRDVTSNATLVKFIAERYDRHVTFDLVSTVRGSRDLNQKEFYVFRARLVNPEGRVEHPAVSGDIQTHQRSE